MIMKVKQVYLHQRMKTRIISITFPKKLTWNEVKLNNKLEPTNVSVQEFTHSSGLSYCT